MTTNVSFRTATADDWPGIWRVFRAVVATGETYMFDPAIDEVEARSAWLFDGLDRRVTYVAETRDAIIGTAILKPNQPGLGDHIANAAWMMNAAFSGRGIGRRFAEYVIEEARRQGFHGMQFNTVVDTNARAIALWESLGFKTVGLVPHAFRHHTEGLVPVRIMYRGWSHD